MDRTIFWITTRGLLGRRRVLLLLPMPLLLVALAILVHGFENSRPVQIVTVLVGFGLAMVVPLTALLAGTGVLSPEIEDGTIYHVLATPVPRRVILLTKLLVACLTSVVVSAPALFAAGLIIGGSRLGAGFALGGAAEAIAYCSVFAALSLVSRRPVLLGLAYVLVWEGLLTRLIPGTAVLSVQQYALTIADRVGDTPVRLGHVSLVVCLVMVGVWIVGSTLLSIDRLRSFSVVGDSR